MYGSEKLNSHYILCYGLSKEFLNQYRHMQYKNIEVPSTLLTQFHKYIEPWVVKNRVKRSVVQPMRKKHQMVTMKDAQKALCRDPKMLRNLASIPHRRTILLNVKLIDFALDQLQQHHVILVLSSIRDEVFIRGRKLPLHFQLFRLYHATKRIKFSYRTRSALHNLIRSVGKANRKHPIFGSADFNMWLYNNAVQSMKTIQALETLIRKQPIRVIMDITEIINSGNTLALLAQKYNLPFILAPRTLVTDMSIIPTRASHYFVWGQNYKDWFIKRGVPANKIYITGNLYFHYRKQNSHLINKNSFLALRLSKTVKNSPFIITYLTQTYKNTVTANTMNWIAYTAERNPNVQFMIKTHPANRFDYSTYTKLHNIHLIHGDRYLYQSLHHSDLILTISSTSAFEAASLKKPIIVLQPPIPYHYVTNNNDFSGHLAYASAGPVVRNEFELSHYVHSFVSSLTYRNQLRQQAKTFLKNSLLTSQNPAKLAYKYIQKLNMG